MKQFEEYDSYILHDCQEKDLVEYDLYLKRCMCTMLEIEIFVCMKLASIMTWTYALNLMYSKSIFSSLYMYNQLNMLIGLALRPWTSGYIPGHIRDAHLKLNL